MPVPLDEVAVGLYIGVLAGMFPGLVAFSLGYAFKYLTNVTVPGFGVVVLAGALAGISGGLMGLVDPALTGSWTGITALLVILMISLWAHGEGDRLAAESPRRLTLKALRETHLPADLVHRVDGLGQVRITPLGVVEDIEGYPSLPEAVRREVEEGSWRFPTHLSVRELEERLEERLADDHELAEVNVAIDRRGRAEIAAASRAAGLSRRVPPGKRAATVRTLVPTGLARGDQVTVRLPKDPVTGPVVSARTEGAPAPAPPPLPAEEDGEEPEDGEHGREAPPPRPATHGGEGRVTVAVAPDEARRLLRRTFAPVLVHSRGKRREYEAVGVLKAHGNRFTKVRVGEDSVLAGRTLADLQTRDTHGVAVLAVSRPGERVVAPRGETAVRVGDELVVVGKPDDLRAFQEVAA